jgi:hypothetical protein
LTNAVLPKGVSLAVYLAAQLGRPKREVVNAIFATGVRVFDFDLSDVQLVLAHMGLSSA